MNRSLHVGERMRRVVSALLSARGIAIVALVVALTPPAVAAMRVGSADIVDGSIQARDVSSAAGTALGNAWGRSTSSELPTNTTLTTLYAENIGKTVRVPRAGNYLLLGEVGADSTGAGSIECELRVDGQPIGVALSDILRFAVATSGYMHFHAVASVGKGTHRFSIVCRESGTDVEIHDALIQFVELRGPRLRGI